MGYGVFNALGLDRDSRPRTLRFDYASTSPEEFEELQNAGEFEAHEDWLTFAQDERDDEFANWTETTIAAGRYLKERGIKATLWTRKDDNTSAWAPYGCRDQHLTAAFEVGKVGAWYQEEPHMGIGLCVVIAPLYHLADNHDVWTMDEDDFTQEYGMSIDAYKASSEEQAVRLTDFILSWMEHEMSAVTNGNASSGSGYCSSYFKLHDLFDLPVAMARLGTVMTPQDWVSLPDAVHSVPTIAITQTAHK